MITTVATTEDVEDIAHNNFVLRMEIEDVHMDINQIACGVRGLITHPGRGFYLLAKQDGETVGQVLVTYEWSDWRNRYIWWLHRIYVKKKWRKKGVLTQLFRRLKKEALGNNVYALRLYLHEENQEAESIYAQLGMEKSPFHIFSLAL
jgi:GNAT superfamily N-acetyltransferase